MNTPFIKLLRLNMQIAQFSTSHSINYRKYPFCQGKNFLFTLSAKSADTHATR